MKYFAFWSTTYAQKREQFDDQKSLLEFVTKAKADPDSYRDFLVIHGTKCEFEPHLIVQAWRIKA